MKNLASQGLVAMTVKQITESFLSGGDTSDLFINGISLKHFSLVGIVSDKDVSNLSFTLHDETGQIDCIIRSFSYKVGETSDAKKMESLRDGSFVLLHGYLDITQGKTQLIVFYVSPIINFNECKRLYSKENSEPQSGQQLSDVTRTTFEGGSYTNQAAPLKKTTKFIVRCRVRDPSTVPVIKKLLAQGGLCCYYSSRQSALFFGRIFGGLKKPSQKEYKNELFAGPVTTNASPSPRDVPIPTFCRRDIIKAESTRLRMASLAWIERTRKHIDLI